jgi:hypothetical protein
VDLKPMKRLRTHLGTIEAHKRSSFTNLAIYQALIMSESKEAIAQVAIASLEIIY